jgi:hypothetical protein
VDKDSIKTTLLAGRFLVIGIILCFCKPGMMYAQIITPGYRILLSYDGQIYPYHSDQRGRVVYCEPSLACDSVNEVKEDPEEFRISSPQPYPYAR